MKTKLCQILMILVALVLCVCACSKTESEENTGWIEYDMDRLFEYISLDSYTGLTITPTSGETKGEAVLRTVQDRAEIHSCNSLTRRCLSIGRARHIILSAMTRLAASSSLKASNSGPVMTA